MFHPNVLQCVCVRLRLPLPVGCLLCPVAAAGPWTSCGVLQGRGELPQGGLSQVNPQPSLPWVFGVVLVWILASHLVSILIASLVSVCLFVFLSFHHRFQAMQSLGTRNSEWRSAGAGNRLSGHGQHLSAGCCWL